MDNTALQNLREIKSVTDTILEHHTIARSSRHGRTSDRCRDILDILASAIAKLENGGWIWVEDGLPEKDRTITERPQHKSKPVWMLIDKDIIRVYYDHYWKRWFDADTGGDIVPIGTHWKPIQLPRKE